MGSIIINIIVGYLVIGHIQSWRWLLEARLKSVDARDPAWAEYLSSIQGIITFSLLGTFLWLPAMISNRLARRRAKSGSGRTDRFLKPMMESIRKAYVIITDLQSSNRWK